MNHQPFEQWLLADDPPVGEQAIELREHLRECPQCRILEANWADVHKLFQTTEQIAPAPGFITRWQTRVQAQQLARNRWHHFLPWILFTLTISIATLLIGILSYQLLQTFHSTTQLLLVKAFFLSIILTILDISQDILSTFFQVSARFPVVQWAFFLGMSGFLGMLWITVGKQLVLVRRISL